ncbi:serine/threonine-protein phosphatase 2A activator isoform X2 [Drosophila eugracilis]|uniref:serine/threonine-protein phosphatase 2A activator isoform X2 n=1 Tax=Drosophila eugracilis TaxID=29029 RepID=UPI001BDA44BB|nr:serine/threonine-protein phosphatase 2A activator isoform X2 [Drosophila eugracilis]
MADANIQGAGKLPVITKRVQNLGDMGIWQRSRAYHDLIGYINGTSSAIQGIKTTDEMFESEMIKNLLRLFDFLEKLVEQHPPLEQPQRFGNKAYRDWAQEMREQLPELLEQLLPAAKKRYQSELEQYLMEAFGNATRIDYGTGHELSFLFFLCSLFKAEILQEQDIVSAALRLFNRYLEFVRQLQRTYNMEPAGSQGVWSLDDFQFVPFIWGSAQLAVKSPFDPSKFVDEQIINDFKDQFMFISCIDYICKVKTGHFGEHSNQLWSITDVPSWVKINAGLVKMYQKEFPVIQHVYFGELMAFEAVSPGTTLSNARLGHVAPPPSKRICIGTSNLVPPVPVSVAQPPPVESLSSDLNVGDSSSESSDSSVVLRPSTSSVSLVAAAEGSGDKPSIPAEGEATKKEAAE